MNTDWKEFLIQQGASIEGDRTVSFVNTAKEPYSLKSTYICDLSNLGLISAQGEEAQSFLYSQFTNDLNLVTPSVSQLSSYCNPKGRMLSIFRVFIRDSNYHILLHRDVLEATLKKLTMFKLMAKVDLSDISDDLVSIGIAGPDTGATLNKLNFTIPNEINHCIQDNETTIIRLPSDTTRMLLITNVQQAEQIWNQCSESIAIADHKLWNLHDIVCGIPHVNANTSEAFIPQMTNLELINGVSFSKGCYPGQEVVARTHYLGKPNRRMFRINIVDNDIPEPGVNIYSPDDENQPVGKIVIAEKITESESSALVVMRTKNQHDTNLHAGSVNGPEITMQSLPYSVDVETKV